MNKGHKVIVQEMSSSILLEQCSLFEREYGLSSANFYSKYLEGAFLGIHDAYRWAGYWKAYLDSRTGGPAPVMKEVSKELLAAAG